MTMTLAQLEAEVLRLRSEIGAYDKDATPWHQRQGQLTDAFTEFAARFADVPGGKLASDIIIAKVKALGLGGGGASSSLPDSIQTDALGRIGIGGPPLVDDRTGKPIVAAGLTIHCIKGGTAAIAFVGNETLDDPQRQTAANPRGDPQRKQITMLSGQGDGWRILWNVVYGEDGKWVPDEFRPEVVRSIDSMGDLCDQADDPYTNDKSQNAYTWLRGRKGFPGQEGNLVYGSPRPGAKVVFLQTSAGSPPNTFDEMLVPVPLSEWLSMKARLSALDGK